MKIDRHQRMMSHVNRWGIAPRLGEQSIADHSYYVTLYSMWLFHEHVVTPVFTLADLLQHALLHDAAEIRTSDMPGPVKHQVCSIPNLAAFEDKVMLDVFDMGPEEPYIYGFNEIKKVVKVADMTDEVMWVAWQLAMGNSLLRTQYNNSMRRFAEAVLDCDDFRSRAAVELAVTEEAEAILHGNFQLPTPRKWEGTSAPKVTDNKDDDEIPF